MPTFVLVSSIGIAITALFAHVFSAVGWNALVGQCVGILAATAWTFTANNRFTWSHTALTDRPPHKVRVTQEETR